MLVDFVYFFFFFFSSRRRHTRFDCDWSSDVCSSDLKFPREKVCGDCLNPSCWAVVERLGLAQRSEEHTSELQSQSNIVCRLLLEKKNAMLLRRSPALHS